MSAGSDLIGQLVDGRYRVESRVGKGGMGSVYRAVDTRLSRPVAVKVMNDRVPDELGARKRFAREAAAMAKLEHPHCASILDTGVHDGTPYVVMDLVAGQSLDDIVAKGPLPVERAVEITRQMLFGLAHAHERGIVHRDIKPANVVLSQKAGVGDHVKLLDFGLAKLGGNEGTNLTLGLVVGTPSYMAPEQVRGQPLDARADLYACGCVLFELLTGRKPFRAATDDPLAVCMMHLNSPPPRLAEALPGHEFGGLEAIVARALAKDRELRYASAEEFARALAGIGEAAETQERMRPSVPPPPTVVFPPVRAASPVAAALVSGVDATMPLSSQQLSPIAPTPAPAPGPIMPPPSASIAPVRATAPKKSRALVGAILALAAAGAIVAVVIAATRHDDDNPTTPPPIGSAALAALTAPLSAPTPAPAPDPDNASSPPTPTADPAAAILASAQAIATRGDTRTATAMLLKARHTYPRDARIPYRAGLLYMEKLYTGDGLAQLRAAIALDPALRADPDLIKSVVRAFNTTASYDYTLGNFLHTTIGAPARPFLTETAQSHPNPIVRTRATAELKRLPTS